MFDRITRKTAIFAAGAAIGAAVGTIASEGLGLDDGQATTFVELIVETVIWFGLIGLGMALGLLIAQNIYLKKMPDAVSLIKPLIVGALSGAIAGGLAQVIYGYLYAQGFDMVATEFFRVICWGLAGLGAGWGVSFFVPNYPAKRALLAGFAGGAIGGMAFILLGIVGLPGALMRAVGIAVLGAAIGLTLSAVEEMLREAWLTVIWGKNETSSVALGAKPVTLGSASTADIYLPRKTFPPLTAILTVENGKVFFDNKLNNQKVALPNGSKINLGKISIVVNVRRGGADKKG
jgi:Ca-activated chloride channel family protein